MKSAIIFCDKTGEGFDRTTMEENNFSIVCPISVGRTATISGEAMDVEHYYIVLEPCDILVKEGNMVALVLHHII
jgi:hypothetical protein